MKPPRMLCVTRAGEKMERETEHWWLEPTRVFALTGKRGPRVIDFTLILASTYKNTLIYVFGADSSLLTKRITVHANSLLMQVYNVRPSE